MDRFWKESYHYTYLQLGVLPTNIFWDLYDETDGKIKKHISPTNWTKVGIDKPTEEILQSYDPDDVENTYNMRCQHEIRNNAYHIKQESQTIGLQLNGPFDGTIVIPVECIRDGRYVTLRSVPALTDGNNTSFLIESQNKIPGIYRPTYIETFIVLIMSNGVPTQSLMKIQPDGKITLGVTPGMDPYPAGSGKYGTISVSVSYII